MNRYWHWVSSDHGSYEDYKARITRPLCRLRLGNGKSRVSCGPCHISTVQCLQGQEVRHLRVHQQHQVEAQPGSCGRPWPWPWNVMNTEDCFKIRFVTQVYRLGFQMGSRCFRHFSCHLRWWSLKHPWIHQSSLLEISLDSMNPHPQTHSSRFGPFAGSTKEQCCTKILADSTTELSHFGNARCWPVDPCPFWDAPPFLSCLLTTDPLFARANIHVIQPVNSVKIHGNFIFY